jgi:hypothetical protein
MLRRSHRLRREYFPLSSRRSATESPRLPPSLPLYKQYHIPVVNVPRDLRRAASLATSLPLQIDQSLKGRACGRWPWPQGY